MSSSKEHNTFRNARRDENPAHPLRKNPASDDFFTDSLLDSSRIPTPSPKKNVKSAFTSKPRRAIGNTRTLRAAWDATASPGCPSPSENKFHSSQNNFKPAPSQARRRSTTNSAKSQSTSSPPRGRQTSPPLASPSSAASSPPRGLNDVYQRIADEERLAAQEGEIEEDDFTDSTMSHDDYVNHDRARLNRIRSSQSPLNLRKSGQNTPQPQTGDANKENHHDETGQTDASGMSFLENMTDQVLAAKLTPHTQDRARDRARLDKAVQKTTPLAFSKAQVGSRHALTSENLQRSGKKENSASVHSSSDGSLRNEDTTPPPNVPRTWGSKGRVEKDWLRKIHDHGSGSANGTSDGNKQDSSQVDWTAAAAKVPLPSVEDSLTPRPEHSRKSTPTSISKQTSIDRIRQWELNDFTGNLQVSNSPPVKVRTNVPDHFRDREIETLEKRAVTTNRLGEIRRKNSHELLSGKSRLISSEVRKGVEGQAPPGEDLDATKIEEEGEPIPDTPIVVYKASTNGTKKDEYAKSRPLHDRRDSRDSLQRLARAISESPRPSSTPEDWSLIKEEEVESATQEIRKLEKIRNESRKSSKEVANADTSPFLKRSRSADAARTPVVTGAWTDTILPDTIRTTQQRHAPSKYAQTPHITGGWIDTPMVTGKRQSSTFAPIPMEDPPDKSVASIMEEDLKNPEKEDTDVKPATKPRPNLPRSALSNLLSKAKRKRGTSEQHNGPTTDEAELDNANNDTLNLGDATIESLEDLLTLDNADMTAILQMGADFDAREMPGQDRDKEAGDPGTETELLERLGTKLERLRTNIHDARKGISKLEHQVSQPQAQQVGTPTSMVKSTNGQQGFTPCQACGCPRGTSSVLPPLFITTKNSDSNPNSKLYLTLPIPRLWHPPRTKNSDPHQWSSYLPRPTLLGYLILTLWLWYLAESVLCHWYCHPEYAEYYTWPDSPREREIMFGRYGQGGMKWGWVLWTLVWRWVFGGSWVGGVGWVVLRGLVRWVGMVMGWTDGFVGEAVGAGAAGGPSSAGLGTSREGGMLGMGEDEYL